MSQELKATIDGPQPARLSHVTECSVARVRAEAAEDGSIYRARIFIRTNLTPHQHTMYMEIGDAMAFRDALSKGIHAALSMTADLNMGKR